MRYEWDGPRGHAGLSFFYQMGTTHNTNGHNTRRLIATSFSGVSRGSGLICSGAKVNVRGRGSMKGSVSSSGKLDGEW